MKIERAIKRRRDYVTVPPSDSLQESDNTFHHRIAVMAYALYEQRGRMDGYALEDWLQAEAIVNDKTERGSHMADSDRSDAAVAYGSGAAQPGKRAERISRG